MQDFADSYLRGETPIPCVRCNQTVKFTDLLATARAGTLSAVLGRTTCHRTVVKRPGRMWRPGRSTASTTDPASGTRLRVPGYPRTRGVPRRKQGVPRRLKRSGTCRLRPERDTRPGTMACVRDGRGVLGCSRAVLGRSVPGRVEASRNGKPVLGRGKSSRDARHRCQTPHMWPYTV